MNEPIILRGIPRLPYFDDAAASQPTRSSSTSFLGQRLAFPASTKAQRAAAAAERGEEEEEEERFSHSQEL